jgi:hypothetical protein
MSDGNAKERTEGSFTTRQRIAYKFDSVVSNRAGQTKFLILVCVIFVVISGLIQNEVNDPGDGIVEAIWESWLYMADPGVQSGAPATLEGRVVALFISLGGIVFFAIIIGFVVDAIQEKMESLKKGRSNVVESGHTVILGWTPFSIAFIKEICDANSSGGGGTIVVLAEKDKEELEIEFYMQVKRNDLLGTKIVFRSGNPMTSSDLLKVSCPKAKSILCLAPGYDSEGNSIQADIADAMTLRSVLALRGLEHTHHLSGHIVAEIRDKDNENLVEMVGAEKVETIVSHDVIGRLMLMSARQPGLAKVFTEVLGFDGDEFYMQAWPQCVGKKFGDVMPHFHDAIVIGVKHFDGSSKVGIQEHLWQEHLW